MQPASALQSPKCLQPDLKPISAVLPSKEKPSSQRCSVLTVRAEVCFLLRCALRTSSAKYRPQLVGQATGANSGVIFRYFKSLFYRRTIVPAADDVGLNIKPSLRCVAVETAFVSPADLRPMEHKNRRHVLSSAFYTSVRVVQACVWGVGSKQVTGNQVRRRGSKASTSSGWSGGTVELPQVRL